MIKAITFDLWNTLFLQKDYKNIKANYIMIYLKKSYPKINWDCTNIIDAIRLADSYAYQISKKNNYRFITTEERFNFILNNININFPLDLRKKIIILLKESILKSPPFLRKNVRNILNILNTKYKIGIISDLGMTTANIMRNILCKKNIMKYFSSTIFSDEIGFYKPHIKMFQASINSLNMQSNEVVHIGDLLETDIVGAKSIGMYTIWFKTKLVKKDKKITPDYIIKNLNQIPLIIKKIDENSPVISYSK